MNRNNFTGKGKKLVLNNQRDLINQKKHEENRIKMTEREEKSKNCGLWRKIKSAWNWFYSGRIKAFIWRILELWAKWTFLGNMSDLLMLITILMAVPFFVQITAIYVSVKMLIFMCFIGVTAFNVARESRDAEEAQVYIDKINQEYCIGLDNIYHDGLLSRAGIKFVWQNLRGRLFDILVTSSCLLFIPTHIIFILYCVFVVMSVLCFLKDIGIAIYWYLDIRNKHRRGKITNLQENFLDKGSSHSIAQIMAERQNLFDINGKKEYPETVEILELPPLDSYINDNLGKTPTGDVIENKHD